MYPSELNLLKSCTGFVKVGANLTPLPRTDEARAEGITAHSMHESMLRNQQVSTEDMTMYTRIVGAVDYVRRMSAGYPLYIEQKLDLSMVQAGMRGMADCLWYNEATRDLCIYDLKYGRVKVEAEDNWQLLAYAAAFVAQYQPVTVTLHIYQPKCDVPDSRHTYSLQEYYNKLGLIQSTITIAHSEQAMCTAGIHCRYCNCLWSCATASHHIIEGMTTMDSPNIEDETHLAAKLTMFSEIRKLAEKKEEQLKAIITGKLTKGERVGSLKLNRRKGRMYWTVPQEILEWLLPEEAIKRKALTPTQVLNGNFLSQTVVESLSKRGYTTSLKIMKQEDYECLKKQES